VLVTGASRRLGASIALELARAGWDVAIHHHQSSPVESLAALRAAAPKGHHSTHRADLADPTACEALVPQVLAEHGRLDAIVNNASIFEFDDVGSVSQVAMERHWRANTAPAIWLSRALHQHVLQRRAKDARDEATGCVVNLLDQKLWNPNPDYFSYTLSKAALEAAQGLLARALAPQLRVCGVAPGVTLPTEGTMNAADFTAAQRMTPLQRSASPEDIARAVRFLLESPTITGTTLLVDGGQHLMAQARDVAFLTPPSNDGNATNR
jgi:NAD(P)-dependent dehydrogenase (short-subunit alcohol dehydrogenase family)